MCPAWYAAIFTYCSRACWWNVVNTSILSKHMLPGIIYSAEKKGGGGCAHTGEQQIFPTALNLLGIYALVHVITERKSR